MNNMTALPKILLSAISGLFIFSAVSTAQPGNNYTKTSDGVIIYPGNVLAEQAKAVKLQVINDNEIQLLLLGRQATGFSAHLKN